MADWPPKKNAAFNVHFPIYDNDGDLVSGAAGLDSEVSIDHAQFADATAEATEIATSSGVYYLALTQAEMNGDIITTITKTSTPAAKTAVNVMYTATDQLADLHGDIATVDGNVDDILTDTGTTLPATLATIDGNVDDILTDTGTTLPATLATIDGNVDDILTDTGTTLPATLATIDGNVDDILTDTGTTLDGRIPAALVGGRMDASVGAMANDVLTAAALAAGAATEIADAILSRDIDQVEATAALHSLCTAILKAVARVRDNAGTLEVYRTDGVTVHMSQTVTSDAALDPIDELTVGV